MLQKYRLENVESVTNVTLKFFLPLRDEEILRKNRDVPLRQRLKITGCCTQKSSIQIDNQCPKLDLVGLAEHPKFWHPALELALRAKTFVNILSLYCEA